MAKRKRRPQDNLLGKTRHCLFYFTLWIEGVEYNGFRFHEGQIASDSSVMYGFDRVAENHEPDGVIDPVKVLDELVPIVMAWKTLCDRFRW